jgi:putative transposase
LVFYSILACAEKVRAAQVLLDPFEEEFDLVAVFIGGCNSAGGKSGVVGQKGQGLVYCGVGKPEAQNLLWVVLTGIEALEHYALIGNRPGASIGGSRIAASSYRTVASLLNMNKNTVQRIFHIRGWQLKKRPIGFRPRVEALPSVAVCPDQRWATDLCRIWAGRNGWIALALVIDCYTRELLGLHRSRSGKAKTAVAALEQALIARFGTLGKVQQPFLLRSDNGLVFTSRSFTALVRSYGLKQEFITPHCPQQNGMVERVIRTLKEQCVHCQRFETLQHANRVISDWIGFSTNAGPTKP